MLFKLETSKLRNMLLVYSKTHISWKNLNWWPHFGARALRKCQNFRILVFQIIGISKFKDILLVYPKAHIKCKILVWGLGPENINIFIFDHRSLIFHNIRICYLCTPKFISVDPIWYEECPVWYFSHSRAPRAHFNV